jgi:hypothetical protein
MRYYRHSAAPRPPQAKTSAAPIKAKKLNRKQRRMKARQRRESASGFTEHDHKKRERETT